MVKGHGKEFNNQRGSATIEAVIGFTAFLFAIFTILGLVNFCRAQMLVSSAVDTAAKEMSQYAYFYQMSGLQKFEEQLDDNASVGKNNINEVIGTVDQLYSSINGAVEQTVQEKTNVANMIAAGDADLQTFENAITGIENSAEGVMQGITGVGNALKDVGNDPLLYMRSLVALIGSEGMEAAKRAVAVPLARSFVSKHFGEDTDAANEKLESLGIEGGLDSMNFNLSNIFSDDEHQDIEITVIYKVKLFQVFDWVVLEANVSKVAVCRAWLGGDDVIVKAVSTEQPSLGPADPTTDGEETDETTDNTDPTEETTDPTEPSVDITDSIWHRDDGDNYDGYERDQGFWDKFREEETLMPKNGNYYYGADADGKPTNVAYTFEHATSADDINFHFLLESQELAADRDNNKDQQFTSSDEPIRTVMIIYVPENISEEEKNKIYQKAQKAEQEFLDWYANSYATGSEEIKKSLKENYVYTGFEIDIRPAGGNYDYAAGGTE